MVLEFIDGPTMSAQTLRSAAMAKRMAASFRRLHGASRFLQDFNMFRLIEYYLTIVETHDVTIPDDYRDHGRHPPVIGRNVVVGMAAVILPGVHIADGAVVAASAVVTHRRESTGSMTSSISK